MVERRFNNFRAGLFQCTRSNGWFCNTHFQGWSKMGMPLSHLSVGPSLVILNLYQVPSYR